MSSNRAFVKSLVGGVKGMKKNYPHVPESILQKALNTFRPSTRIEVSTKRLVDTVERLYSNHLLNTVKTVAKKKRLPISFLRKYSIKTKKTMKPRTPSTMNLNLNFGSLRL